MASRFKIQLVYDTGDVEFLMEGDHEAIFQNKAAADEQVEFMKMGMGHDEGIVSISAVKA